MDNFRKDFPIFKKEFDPKKIVYLDSAATTLKPKSVISRILQFYEHETSNISRGNHFLGENNFLAFEEVRAKTASFLKCQSDEIVFTQNTTDSINTVAQGLNLKPEDEIIVSILEHHSNYLPWLNKAKVKIAPANNDLIIDIEKLEKLITPHTKLISICQASNITGNVHPIEEIIKIAKKRDILVLIDAAQSISHLPMDVKKLGCDFLTFSAHKMFGPSGVGVLYVSKEMQPKISPTKYGGGMANRVTLPHCTFKPFPYLFEAGTPNIEGILGFGKALDYFAEKGFEAIQAKLHLLENYLRESLQALDFIDLLPFFPKNHLPLFTFIPKNERADIGMLSQTLSDSFKIILRSGFHCSQLIYNEKGLNGGLRVSLHVYNNKKDVDSLISALNELKGFF
jgi:cysteine desulfurase / selenocysteine lyase